MVVHYVAKAVLKSESVDELPEWRHLVPDEVPLDTLLEYLQWSLQPLEWIILGEHDDDCLFPEKCFAVKYIIGAEG
jgi:hypothetical protein